MPDLAPSDLPPPDELGLGPPPDLVPVDGRGPEARDVPWSGPPARLAADPDVRGPPRDDEDGRLPWPAGRPVDPLGAPRPPLWPAGRPDDRGGPLRRDREPSPLLPGRGRRGRCCSGMARQVRAKTSSAPARRGHSHCEIRRRPTLPGGLPPSTIGAGGLNCRVRHGNGCDPAALATGNLLSTWADPTRTPERARVSRNDVQPSPRPISTGRLNALPHVHLRPINVVV